MAITDFVSYNMDTGEIVTLNKERPTERVRFFSQSKKHYKSIFIDGTDYLSHRLAFLIVNGSMPANHVDHLNGNGLDNRWENIREVTQAENNLNKKVYSSNSTGVSGVTIRDGKYRVRIRFKGVLHNVGTYKTLLEAKEARKKKEQEFGFHENHGTR
jgi:hypothetical protein